ncbi:MAG: Brp/Blh family beta-carotene 15,15'-dioxygenase, partial [Actinomycetota bacterium]
IVLGIPHGALDHLVVETLDGRTDGSRRRFVRNYLAAMVGAGLIWLAWPSLALVAFLAISVHHFGQSDLARLRLGGVRQIALQWSRGLLLVGLPLVAHVEVVAPVIADLGGGDVAAWSWLSDRWWMWAGALIVQHAVVGVALMARSTLRATLVREAAAVVALSALFLTAHPLVGFAVYFGLWHALGHLVVLADVLGVRDRPVRSMIVLAAPLTAVSLVGLAAAWVGASIVGRADLLVPVMFVFVSMLTVPHLVVVERLWRDR